MSLIKTFKRYKKRIEKRFSRHIERQQFNFYCDPDVITMLKDFSYILEIPIYVFTEHCLQTGLSEMIELIKDEALRDDLCRHLVQDHLLTPVTKPQSEPVSRRLRRLRNVRNLLNILEINKTPDEQMQIILELIKRVRPGKENEG
ncbi:hypothetical protein ACFLV5_04235 [Chloroflexota bacterium]